LKGEKLKSFLPFKGRTKSLSPQAVSGDGDGPDRVNGISASSRFLRTKAKDREPQEGIIFERHERHGFPFPARDD
jgi:hypothetical protein